MNITEDYVSFETAKLLKEKGFDDRTYLVYFYYAEDDEWVCDEFGLGEGFVDDVMLLRPSQSQVMKWLRVNYNIHIEPRYFPMPNIYRYVIIHSPTTIENIDSHPQYFNTYEEACESAIKYCLNNLI